MHAAYPEGPLFAHTVGYSTFLVGDSGWSRVRFDELRSRQDLTISDLLAALFGRDLRPRTCRPPCSRSSSAAYEALGNQRGAVVALDPRGRRGLGYVTTPSFDPNSLLGPTRCPFARDCSTTRIRAAPGPGRPALYPPGSSFKTVVAAAGIETGVAGPETEFDDVLVFDLPGSDADISNAGGGPCAERDHSHPPGGVRTQLQHRVRRPGDPGRARRRSTVARLRSASVADSTSRGRSPCHGSRPPNSQNDPAALGQSGLGERDVRATPLVMAMVAAAIANEGEVMQPRIVDQVFDADGRTVRPPAPSGWAGP
jgi:penicillin-binding protein A